MEKTAELIKQITERLNRRPARIDKADRLWGAAVVAAILVAGSAVFGAADPAAAVRRLAAL